MSKSLSVRFDWITVTGKTSWEEQGFSGASFLSAQEFARERFTLLNCGGEVIKSVKPSFGYHFAFQDVANGGTVNVSTNLQEQGWSYVATGETCARLGDAGIVVRSALRAGCKFTRLDIAYDFMRFGVPVAELYQQWLALHGENKQRKRAYISSMKGDTFNLGSRSSEKYLRVYDKGGQQGVDVDWIRVEFELKGFHAERAARECAGSPYAAGEWLARFVDVPQSPLMQAIELAAMGDRTESKTPPRAAANRERWFYSQVMSSLGKWAEDDPRGVLDWISEAYKEIDRAEHRRMTRGVEPIV